RLSPDYTDEESRRAWEGNAFATPLASRDPDDRAGADKAQLPPYLVFRKTRYERELCGRGGMVRESPCVRKTSRLVRALRAYADDGGTGQVSSVACPLRPPNCGTRRRHRAMTRLSEMRACSRRGSQAVVDLR